jgi:tetratricopeptide (TPR) repeat protein
MTLRRSEGQSILLRIGRWSKVRLSSRNLRSKSEGRILDKQVKSGIQVPNKDHENNIPVPCYSFQYSIRKQGVTDKIVNILRLREPINDAVPGAGDPAQALARWKTSFTGADTTSDASVFLQKGINSIQSENYQEAIENFDRAIELNPQLVDAYYNRGRA